MKCKKCYGDGWVLSIVPKNNGECITERVPCEFCHGSGEVPMTNEEYLRSCTTEQLAEWIVHLADDCTMQHECRLCNSWCDEKRVIEWLKQPHREERKK